MSHPMGKVDDTTLAYMDQASLMGLRALGRGPVIQYVWIYNNDVDLDALRRVQRNLAHTLLGRLIERSPLPFGRHRWVAVERADAIDVSPAERRRDQVWEWADERAQVPVDPEAGPPWHLGVQPFVEGGAGVSLVVSHTVADAGALILSLTAAIEGTLPDMQLPKAGARRLPQALREDVRTTMRAVTEVPGAVAGAARAAREQSGDLADSAKSSVPSLAPGSNRPVTVPTVYVAVDLEQWKQKAKELGGTTNVMLAGLAARIGKHLGRLDDDGRAMLSMPVSERHADDTRANALLTITVLADPDKVLTDLSEVRAEIKEQLTDLAATRDALLAPIPLTPYVPKILVRRLEKLVLKVGPVIGCSNTGDMPPAVNRIGGSEADGFAARLVEPGITAATLAHMGGHLMLPVGNIGGKAAITVSSWVVGGENTRAALRPIVERALADFELDGVVE
jgi:diacylglycerol O-acyltransferase / wax synthase